MTEPRADPDIFNLVKTQSKMMLGNMKAQPMFAFQEALNEALTQNHPRARTPTPEMLDKMDLNKAMAFYKDRFGDAGDFTFVFVGTFNTDTMKPLVEKYIASLPSNVGSPPPRSTRSPASSPSSSGRPFESTVVERRPCAP